MKKIIFLVAVLLLIIARSSYAKPIPKNDLTIISVKKHVVYFKVDKSFVGGSVEVFNAGKECVEADSLPHTHTMVYFDEVPAGHYTIKVRKGKHSTEFEYINL